MRSIRHSAAPRLLTASMADGLQPGAAASAARAGLRLTSFALAAVAMLAAAFLSARPASASGIFVRSATAARPNEADLVTEGTNHTLQYYYASPTGTWHHIQVAGAGTTYSAPSIFVRSATQSAPNEADIVAEGPNHTLQYYHASPTGTWHHTQIAGAGTTYSAPSIFVRSATANQPNEADIAAEGPNNTLQYYLETPGSAWQHFQVGAAGTTYSAPSIFVRSPTQKAPNEVDIVAEGPNHSLQYFLAFPGSAWQRFQVGPAGSTFSAPSIFVWTEGEYTEADIVAEGPNHTLLYYFAPPGSAWQHVKVAGPGTTYSAPSVFIRTAPTPGEADIVAEGPNHTLRYYFQIFVDGAPWEHAQVASPGTTYSTPSIFVRTPTGTRPNEADLVAEGPNHTLRYYWATPGSQWHPTRVASVGTTYSG